MTSSVTAGVIVVGMFIMFSGLALMIFFVIWIKNSGKRGQSLAISALCLTLGLFWGADLVAGIGAQNLIGKPDKTSKALFWTFWVFDRAGLFTF